MKNNDWIDIAILDDYLEGRLGEDTMYQVERITLEDPFVAEALAGLAEAKKRNTSLSILQKQLQERVQQRPVERRRWNFTTQRLSIAATAAVLFVTVTVFFWMRENQRQEQALATAKKAQGIEIQLKNDEVMGKANDANQGVAVANSAVAPDEKNQSSKMQTVDSFVKSLDKTPPEPVDGWLKFNEYMDKNNQFSGDGEKMVELGFVIAENGAPKDILILNGQSDKLNNEAIRLLSQGPKWKYNPKAANKGTLIVKF